MAADVLVDGTRVQAGAAADASQDLRGLARKDPAPAVVEQNHVEFLWTRLLVRLLRAADESGVSGELLPGGGTREDLEEEIEVRHGRHKLLNPHHDHVNPGKRRDHPAVPLVRHQADRPRLHHSEVRTGDPQVGAQKRVAEFLPRVARQRAGVVAVGDADPLLHQPAHVLAGHVGDRKNDVRGATVGELHDVLAEVGLDDFEPRLRQRCVEMRLLRGHRLTLHYPLQAALLRDLQDDAVRLSSILRPVHLRAVRQELALEPL